MKKFVVALFLLPLLLLTIAAKPKPADPTADPPAFEVLVSIAPVEDSQFQLLPHHWRNAFRCSATLTDIATGAPKATVEAVVQPGKRATEIKKVEDVTILFGVQIDESLEAAVSEVVLKRGDRLLLRQRSMTRFAPVPRGFPPR